MAANELKIDQIVQVFCEIIKRKTTYNETNLHYEYFKRVGDTIPYKAHGFLSLRDFLEKNAGNRFYFERVGKDLEFIAPKRIDGECSSDYSVARKEQPKKLPVVKRIEQNEVYSSGSEKSKRVLVSNNIYFGQPQSTGVNNPFQNIRNDIKISFDFDSQKREVDRRAGIVDSATECESATNSVQINGGKSNSAGGDTYSLVSRDDKQMDVDDGADCDFPWDDKYWHLSITAAVSTNEIWARLFDPFEVKLFVFKKLKFSKNLFV